MNLLNRKSYWYNLPEEQIAQFPIPGRSASRLLVLNKNSGEIKHQVFGDICDYLVDGDVLVINTSKVIPARLIGRKPSGAKIEVFMLEQVATDEWECLVKPGKRMAVGSEVIFSENFKAEVTAIMSDGSRQIKFYYAGDFWECLDEVGTTPLPPYIKRAATDADKLTYQTIYAQEKGSVAAPTAGLHFTDEIMKKLTDKGVEIVKLVLHVGLGTFRPVKTELISEHFMHSEWCEITRETALKINDAKAAGRRIIAVGTTSTRTLESFATADDKLAWGQKATSIFIHPPRQVKIIDGLITNFHMPESTLMMLVSATGGYENIMKAYKEAVIEKYRFFSYGDSMLII